MKKSYTSKYLADTYFGEFTLGRFYNLNGSKDIFQFIKTTTKGFNMLNTRTSKCLFNKGQLYSWELTNKEIPENQTTFKKIRVWNTAVFKEIPCQL